LRPCLNLPSRKNQTKSFQKWFLFSGMQTSKKFIFSLLSFLKKKKQTRIQK
jgi:hypothetical protein